jgi:methyl-accepting chemotaxis protein
MSRMSTSIQKIKESSDQTAKIVKTIDEIAMQTNLLALNAAVEAARAGEAGRGFAVVAEEVRNLAQRSAQAAKNTADMIGESVRNADDGVKIATEVSTSFDRIAGSSKKVNDLIAEIAAASKEQAAGIKQVNDAVSQMDKVTQQNAANAEESASASEELSSQAAELQAMVAQFNIGKAVSRAPAIATKHTKALPGLRSSDPARKPRIVSAEEVIPMDEDILKDF